LVQNMAPVRGDLGSYAGYPLQTSSGHVLGSLCVIDRQPRQWTGEQLALLGEVAAIVLQEIEHRLAARTIDDIRGLTGQLIVGLDGTVDAVRGLADLVEQQDDLRLHRFAAGALSKVDQVKDLTVRLQREAVDWVGRATGPASVDTREVVDLCEVVDRAVRSTRLMTGTDVLEVDLGSVSLPVRGDPLELERSTAHVLVAALHHTTGNGPLHVRVRPTTASDGLPPPGRVAQLTVSGASSRVPAAELARIVSRLQVEFREGSADGGEPASMRMAGGRTSASNGSVTASSSEEGLTLVACLPLDPDGGPAVEGGTSPCDGGTSSSGGGRHRRAEA
jgi:hypothetical protein